MAGLRVNASSLAAQCGVALGSGFYRAGHCQGQVKQDEQNGQNAQNLKALGLILAILNILKILFTLAVAVAVELKAVAVIRVNP
jgi:hypothetical protein